METFFSVDISPLSCHPDLHHHHTCFFFWGGLFFLFFWKNGARTQLHKETMLVRAKRPAQPERWVDWNEWPAECFGDPQTMGPSFACLRVC